MTFFYQTLPIFMRQQGASLETIGALGFLALPWMLKFLWSPLIDRYSFNRNRHYGSWILFFQIFLAACVAIASLLDIRQQFLPIIGLTFLACLFSASQDIATDALAVRILAGEEKAWGSTIQSVGHYLGSIVGSGGMLILLDRFGWRWSLLAISGWILVAGMPLLKYREAPIEIAERAKPNWRSIVNFFQRDRMILWVVILAIYSGGSNMVGVMMRPLLIDLKFSLTEIGQIIGLVSCSAGIVGAFVGGAIVNRWGVKQALIWFGIFQGISVLACLPLVRGVADPAIVYASNISLQFFGGMCDIAIATVMLEKSEPATAATDYTIQTSLIYLSAIFSMFGAGMLSENFGYNGMLFCACGVCIVSLSLVAKFDLNLTKNILPQLMPSQSPLPSQSFGHVSAELDRDR